MARLSPEYLAYIGPPASPEWEEKRQQKLAEASYQCERCGRKQADGWTLHVHHWTYERLFHELMRDLEVLCEEHHKAADEARKLGYTRHSWRPGQESLTVGASVRSVFRKMTGSAPGAYRYKVVREDDGTWRVSISFMRSEAVVADGIIDEGMARGLCERIRAGQVLIADLAIIRATAPRQLIDGF